MRAPSGPLAGRTLRTGFTLVEMLVVVAIIGILAALLLTSVSSVVKKSGSVECLSNLRQIYLISQSFAADNDGYTPQAWWYGSSPKPAGVGPNLTDYGFNGQKLSCPSYRKIAPDLTYGINLRLVTGPPGAWGDRNIFFNIHGRYKFLAYPKPAATLFFVDASVIEGRTTASYFTTPDSVDFRHGKKANAVFLDGHAAALTPEDVTNAYSGDLLPGY